MKRKTALLYCLGLLAAGYAGFAFHQHYGFFTGHADTVLGRVERIYIKDAHFGTPGRIDTGAGVSSIGVEIIKIKKPQNPGEPERVVFRIPDNGAKVPILEREIVDWQNIKKKGVSGYLKRPVVVMNLCIAGRLVKERVNLADRTHYLYPILIGRNTLKTGNFMVDPAQLFTHHAVCR